MKLTEALTAAERQLVVALCVSAACVLTLSTVFNYLLVPIEAEFAPSEAQMTALRQAPAIAALLVVFPAGALGSRIGEKRFVLWCSLLFTAGSILVAVAPGIEVVTLGFLIANVGRAAMFIVGLGYMASSISGKDGRAAGFAFFSMILPIVYVFMPVIAGAFIDGVGWRWVAALCAMFGLVGATLIQRLVPRREGSGALGEMWTPAVAGIALTLLVQALNAASSYGFFSSQVLTEAVGAGVAFLILVILMRKLKSPSLSLRPLRQGGFALLLIALMLFGFANLWFYTTMALQYIFGLSSMETAVAMIPAQLASLGGAALAGRLIQKYGISRAGFWLILGVAAFLWCSMVVSEQSPLWLPILIVSLYSLAAVGAGVPITNAIMNNASKGSEGDASAYRGAATNLGSSISVAFMTAIVATGIGLSLQAQYQEAGITLSAAETVQMQQAINAGESASDVAQQYNVPVETVQQMETIEIEALVGGYRTHGLVGGFVTLGVSIAFLAVTRRHERQDQV